MSPSRTRQVLDTWDELTTDAARPPARLTASSRGGAPIGLALVGAIVLAVVLIQGWGGVGALRPTAVNNPSPTSAPSAIAVVRDFSAPGSCSQTTEFAYVGVSTLTDLGFGRSTDPDFSRTGHFWITAYPVPRTIGLGPPGGPLSSARLSPTRIVCVQWLDGKTTGLKEMDVPEGWPETPLPT
jgi:hypothetical protein